MIYENPINFQKLVRCDSNKKNSVATTFIKSIIFCKFKIFFISNNIFYNNISI